jgi:hypothetical protein
MLLLVAATGGQAATEIVLQDGRTLEVTSIERRDDVYVITLESGGALAVPVALVTRVGRTEGPAAGPSPAASGGWTYAEPQQLAGEPPDSSGGWTYAEPQQLAGAPTFPLDPARALEVLGRPSAFRPSVVDPNWAPRSGFPGGDVLERSRSTFRAGPIDATWLPRSAFSGEDVLARSRSTFVESLIDSTWVPEDGFARKRAAWSGAPAEGLATSDAGTRPQDLSSSPTPARDALEWARLLERGGWYRRSLFEPSAAVRVEFDLFADRPSDRSKRVRGCAREVFAVAEPKPAPEPRRLGDPRYALLPLDVYEAESGGSRAVFTVAGDACHALGGDLRDPLGVRLSREQSVAAGIDAYNASLGERIAAGPTTDAARIEYVAAVLAVVDPDVSGPPHGSLLLVPDAEVLRQIVERPAPGCAVELAARRRSVRAVEQSFEPPRVTPGVDGSLVEFFTWSSIRGDIVRHAVALRPGGEVTVAGRTTIASHLGEHVDRD